MKNIMIALFTLMLGCGACTAHAGTVSAVQTNNGSAFSWRLVIGADQSATVGWSFTVGAQNVEVDALGFYDDAANGLVDAHPVGIWTSSGTLIAQTTVPSGTAGTLVGSYRYTAISPLTLLAGQTYVIGTYFGPVIDTCSGAGCGDVLLAFGTETYDPRIAFAQSRQNQARNGAGSLAFPNLDGGIAEGFFGPNFLLAADTTPDPFNFIAQTGVALSTVATSNAITVSGIDSPSPISIVGGTYSINGGAYTSVAGTVNNGDAVTARQTSSASFNTLTTATLTIGTMNAVFDVTTLAADTTPDAFSFTAQTGVPLNTVVTSNAVTVGGINSPIPISIVGGTYSINGGAYTSVAGTVNNGDAVTARQTSSASFNTLTTATLTIGTVNAAFDVSTLAAPAIAIKPAPTLSVLALWIAAILVLIAGSRSIRQVRKSKILKLR